MRLGELGNHLVVSLRGDEIVTDEALPLGGVTLKKYAAIALALGMARGALLSSIAGDIEGAQDILDLTSTARLGEALGFNESELAIIWDEHLSNSELNQLKGFGASRGR